MITVSCSKFSIVLKGGRGKGKQGGEKEIDGERGDRFKERYNEEVYACIIGDSGTLAMILHGSKISYPRIIEMVYAILVQSRLFTAPSDGETPGPGTVCATIITKIPHTIILFSWQGCASDWITYNKQDGGSD